MDPRRQEQTTSLPPRELWPDRIYALPELHYRQTLNLATELLDVHVTAGRRDSIAIVANGHRTTYGTLQTRANHFGHALISHGVRPGDRVLLRLPNRPDLVALWLAVQKIGAVCVTTPPMLRARELAYIVNDVAPRACVVAGDLLDEVERAWPRFQEAPLLMVAGLASRAIALPAVHLTDLAAPADAALEAHPTTLESLAVIAYTSGTAAEPKGTCHSVSDVLASADTYACGVLGASQDDVFGGQLSMAFTYGLGGLLVFPLRFGAATVLAEEFAVERLLTAIQRDRITLLFCTATAYRLLLRVPDFERRFDLDSLRLCVSAGEPLDREVAEAWTRRTGKEIIDSLGTTEMFHVFLSQRPGGAVPGSIGVPVPGYEVRAVDECLADVAPGAPGRLAVRGPSGCRYWRKPEAQRDYVRRGWNLTGDVVVKDERGDFWFLGRNDDLIISAGYNIAGAEVEAVLLEHPAVHEAAVVASPDPIRRSAPKAFIVLKPGVAPDGLVLSLQEHMQRALAGYKCPRRYEFVESLPKTESGQIRRAELRAREHGSRIGDGSDIASNGHYGWPDPIRTTRPQRRRGPER